MFLGLRSTGRLGKSLREEVTHFWFWCFVVKYQQPYSLKSNLFFPQQPFIISLLFTTFVQLLILLSWLSQSWVKQHSQIFMWIKKHTLQPLRFILSSSSLPLSQVASPVSVMSIRPSRCISLRNMITRQTMPTVWSPSVSHLTLIFPSSSIFSSRVLSFFSFTTTLLDFRYTFLWVHLSRSISPSLFFFSFSACFGNSVSHSSLLFCHNFFPCSFCYSI